MRRLKILLEKEFRQIFRDPFMPKLIFIIPIIQLIILPFAADFEMKNIKLCLIDRDNSPLSLRLFDKINSSKYFLTDINNSSYKTALDGIEKNNYDIIFEIPRGFEKDLYNQKNANTLASVNAINGTKGGLGVAYLGYILSDFSKDIAPFISKNSQPQNPKIEILGEDRFNINLDFKAFIVPGVVVFLLSITSGLLATVNIVREKEDGTMEQLNVAPVTKLTFIASKIIPFWIIGILLMTIGMIVAYFIYGLFPEGSFFTIYAFAAIYMTAFTGFGLVVSNYSDSMQQALITFVFSMMVFLLMSGLFTPISSMPIWAQKITILNPVKYFIEVMRAVYMRGAGLSDIAEYFLIITCFALVINSFAVTTFRRNVS